MHIVVRRSGIDEELQLFHRSEATLADLLDALDVAACTATLVDGRPARPDDTLDELGLCWGSVLELDSVGPPPGPRVEVIATGGLRVARSWSLGEGAHVVGRSPACHVVLDDPGVAPLEAILRVEGCEVVPDGLGGVVPQRRGDTVTVGPVPLRIRAEGGARPVLRRTRTPAGTRVVNRPPRHHGASPGVPLPTPAPPVAEPFPARLALATVVVPLALAAVLWAATGSWLFVLMTAMAPVMAVATWLGARGTRSRSGRRERIRWDAELAAFHVAVVDARRAEAARRWAAAVAPGELVDRASGRCARLWERRLDHPDALCPAIGVGPLRWRPPLVEDRLRTAGSSPAAAVAELDAVIAAEDGTQVPVEVGLGDGGVIGVVGPADAARHAARHLVLQLCVLHGPADVGLVVATDRPADWDWAAWLPHARRHGSTTVTGRSGPAQQLLSELVAARQATLDRARRADAGRPGTAPAPLVVVIDAPELVTAPRSAARAVLRGEAGPVVGVVVASDAAELPASCSLILHVDETGRGRLSRPAGGAAADELSVWGIDVDTATALAVGLARFEDPEDPHADGLPADVGLLHLVPEAATAEGVQQRWRRGPEPRGHTLAVPLAVDARGPVSVDLVLDGPHALVAGTTGAGKSELLRSWVVALAATYDPTELHLILIDYKGGSAFDECARLPHTVAVVTDLDDALGARALRCLEAELRHREGVLRAAGAAEVADTWRGTGTGALARLVVVIDEFAALAAELPDFLAALVGIAQRGRSLGVHLVLATQRPAGVVSDDIRANTNLRISLRVQDRADALDVVGTPDAATLPRERPGRALVRFGAGEVLAVQGAFGGRPTAAPGAPPVRLRPLGCTPPAASGGGPAPSELAVAVTAVVEAARRLGAPPARRPWPDPLPARVDPAQLADLAGTGGDVVPFLLVDDPDRQRRCVGGWDPAAGNLVVYGSTGTGKTTALTALALAAAERWSADALHLYALGDRGGLGALAGLPHAGAVVRAGDQDRIARLVRVLGRELRHRLGNSPAAGLRPVARVLVLIDGVRSVFADLEEREPAVAELLARLVVEGPTVGLFCALTAEHAGGVRHTLAAGIAQRLVLPLADPVDARQLGLTHVGARRAGRAVRSGDGLEVQVVWPGEVAARVAALAASTPPPAAPPLSVPPPAEHVAATDVLAGAVRTAERWFLPVGRGGDELAVVGLTVHPGEHVLVAGPARSGRTATLRTVVGAIRAADLGAVIVGIAGPRSDLARAPLTACFGPDELTAALAALGPHPAGAFLVVDDADALDDPDGRFEAAARAGVHLVVAGRNDVLRTAYGHWTRRVRGSRSGVLLHPDADLDGELLAVRLPRRTVGASVGRGVLVADGEPVPVQVADPETGHEAGPASLSSP